MHVLDFLEPLPVHRSDECLAAVLRPLEAGTPVAFADTRGWRLVQPFDAVAFPGTRQLCDLPNRRLPVLPVAQPIDLASLAENEVWGAVRNQTLLGRVDSLRVLSTVAAESEVESEQALAMSARDRLMPRLLHDLANALTVAMAVQELPDPDPTHWQASNEAVRHAGALVMHMRSLYVPRVGPIEKVWAIDEVLGDIGAMLDVAARPASLAVACAPGLAIRGQRWRLESALLNLVLNASEQADNVRIEVRAAGRQRVELRVEDDGPGFEGGGGEPAVAPPKTSMHGHGLPSIRRQVLAMGGRLRLERSALGGALVRINLPRAW